MSIGRQASLPGIKVEAGKTPRRRLAQVFLAEARLEAITTPASTSA
jgi:hypothetical protein